MYFTHFIHDIFALKCDESESYLEMEMKRKKMQKLLDSNSLKIECSVKKKNVKKIYANIFI